MLKVYTIYKKKTKKKNYFRYSNTRFAKLVQGFR